MRFLSLFRRRFRSNTFPSRHPHPAEPMPAEIAAWASIVNTLPRIVPSSDAETAPTFTDRVLIFLDKRSA
jgi:hypothetical protein